MQRVTPKPRPTTTQVQPSSASLRELPPRIVRTATYLLVVVSALATASCYQPFSLVKALQQDFPEILFYVPTDSSFVAFTFDDGPNPPHTDRVLDILEENDARGTFFVIGSRLEAHPGYLHRIWAASHQVANHLYGDRTTVWMSIGDMVASLEQTESLIDQPSEARYFRPGGGWITPEQSSAAQERGYRVVLGSAYVFDNVNPPRWYMRRSLKSMLRPGAIVVLHDGGGDRRKTIDILPDLLAHAGKKGLKCVTLDELVRAERPGTPQPLWNDPIAW